jgi:hypothetical protein
LMQQYLCDGMWNDGIDNVCRSVSVAWDPQRIRFPALQLLTNHPLCDSVLEVCYVSCVQRTNTVTVRLIHVTANLTLQFSIRWIGANFLWFGPIIITMSSASAA